ncbi:peptidylprolyl isomerase [Kitasatospora sp. NPDC088346]|uniref:peptidylprolyl isomerase n=1 Tax=Kitasatospora sp. NPDC088346 TaxID=3364073 RepID=UPI003806570B
MASSNEQRRRQLAREKYERQATRRAEAHKHRKQRNAIVGAALAVVVVAAGGAWAGGVFDSSDKGKNNSPQAAPDKTAPAAQVKGCNPPAAGTPNGKQWQTEPAMSVDTKAAYTATLDTSCGPVTVSLDAAKAPHTVNSFAFLAGEQYFDHVKCHRLTTEGIYVLQCGDPTGTGSGGPGYKFPDENLTGATYPAGTLAMANAGPGTNGSQFFLVYKDTQLPPNYTPFGKITGGLDVLQNIAGGGVQGGGGDGAPVADVVLNKVAVAKG